MTAKLNESMRKRMSIQKAVEAIKMAAPSDKAANAAIKMLFGNKHGGTRRR